METQESLREIENLRLRFRMNNRLRLESLAALSKIFREHGEPLSDELLASVVFAIPEELNGNGHAYAAERQARGSGSGSDFPPPADFPPLTDVPPVEVPPGFPPTEFPPPSGFPPPSDVPPPADVPPPSDFPPPSEVPPVARLKGAPKNVQPPRPSSVRPFKSRRK